MKRFLLLLILPLMLLGVNGCNVSSILPDGTIVEQPATPEQNATMVLVAIKDQIAKVPAAADLLFTVGTIDKEQYNKIATLHNKVRASWFVASDALKICIVTDYAPDKQAALEAAMAEVEKLNKDLINLMLQFQGGM